MKQEEANELLLKAVRERSQKPDSFGYGILTADKHVQNVQDHIGLTKCYKLMTKRNSQTSFNDIMLKASNTLVYSNDEMLIEEKKRNPLRGVTLPKNTLMVFRHVLTSTRKDRDGDILRTKGAEVDPRMLLLWQHVHTLPIGKMLKIETRTKDRLELISAIVDMNELCHDAAVMVDNDMSKFSHGFRALEFEELEADKDGSPSGFDVKRFEIMEESMVSVPSNVDANTEEVLLSLVDGGKLTSPLMKELGQGIREHRNVSVPVSFNVGALKITVEDTKETQDEDESTDETGRGSEEREARASKETDAAGSGQVDEAEGTDSSEVVDVSEEKQAAKVAVNPAGMARARKLVKAGSVETPDDWDPPTPAEQNAFIEKEGIGEFAKFHLGVREGVDPESKGAWAFPFTSDFQSVDRSGLIAIRQRAGQQNNSAIFETAGNLIDKIDGKAFRDLVLTTCGILPEVGIDWKNRPEVVERIIEEYRETGKFNDIGIGGYAQTTVLIDGLLKRVDKAGRSLSKANENRISEAKETVDEVVGMEIPRAAKAALREASSDLGMVLDAVGTSDETQYAPTAKEAMGIFLGTASEDEQNTMLKTLQTIEKQKQRSKRVEEFRALVSGNGK